MANKLYSRVSNFEDIDPLTGNTDSPLPQNRVTFSRAAWKFKTNIKCILGSLIIVALVVCLLLALVIGISYALARSEGSNGRGECELDPKERFDCLPGVSNVNEASCSEFDCCWEPKEGSPSCFYSLKSGYASSKVEKTPLGNKATLTKLGSSKSSPYGPDVAKLEADFRHETNTRLRVRITDPSKHRYEVPLPLPTVSTEAPAPDYTVEVQQDPAASFSFTVIRKDTGTEIFKIAPGLVFSDQFLQLSTYLPSGNVYGIGEHAKRLRLDTDNFHYSLFASDIGTNPDDPGRNLYGVHPFYMCLETNGQAHGVLLLNSNAMEVFLSPKPSLTWRAIGGVLDLFLFTGPSPDSVVQQYTALIGRPIMPPYWALGFHLCRWGYGTANSTRDVVERMRELQIPQDVQWSDIDYMDRKLVFTYDQDKFRELPELVDDLHSHGQKYIIIADPGISNRQRGYSPYDTGLDMNVFIKNSSGLPIEGIVWPNETVYPDFTHPNATSYWTNLVRDFHKIIPFDGLWIDMNEPSNFVAGSTSGCPSKSSLNNPPFIPESIRSQSDGILTKTLCMTANQSLSTHYNLHSLYGHTEAVVTRLSLDSVLGRRSLLISRSTYVSGGAHTGHWLGDNTSQWKHLKYSIPGILDFALFGIPMVGADICGFFSDTEEELCTRWQQVGAFYPFSRNHNTIGTKAQDPTVWSNDTIDAIRDALNMRYRLLPYLYTLFYWSNVQGSTVARPLFFEFPLDKGTWDLDTQFMWGGALLISPVLDQGLTSVTGYFPSGRWFDLRNGTEIQGGAQVELEAPLSTIPLHIRGGYIIPTQSPGLTTAESRMNPFSLIVALDEKSEAAGDLFVDDGESLDSISTSNYTLLKFSSKQTGVSAAVVNKGEERVVMEEIMVYGLPMPPTNITLNNSTVQHSWSSANKVLFVSMNNTDVQDSGFDLKWTL